MTVDLDADAEVFDRDPHLGEVRSERRRQLLMGDIARVAGTEVSIAIDVLGTAPIERLDLYDGLELLETIRPYGPADLGSRVRLVYEGAECRGRARTTIWDGVLRIDGNRIARAGMINNWNLDRGIQQLDPSQVTWKAVTTGNYGALDLWLDHGTAGRLAFETAPVSGEVAIADLGIDPLVYAAGGLDRAVRLQRLPDQMTARRMTMKRRVKLRETGDTRLFIRLQQEDGHRAWTSPIYLFRG